MTASTIRRDAIYITLPQLSGGRQRAQAMVARHAGRLAGKTVVVDCRDLVAGTQSFADELVKEALVKGKAARLSVEYAGDLFGGYLMDSARDHGVEGKVTLG